MLLFYDIVLKFFFIMTIFCLFFEKTFLNMRVAIGNPFLFSINRKMLSFCLKCCWNIFKLMFVCQWLTIWHRFIDTRGRLFVRKIGLLAGILPLLQVCSITLHHPVAREHTSLQQFRCRHSICILLSMTTMVRGGWAKRTSSIHCIFTGG